MNLHRKPDNFSLVIGLVIVAALNTELKYVRPHVRTDGKVHLLLTGVGKIRSLRSLDECSRRFAFDRLLNVGTAGSLSQDLSPGSIVVPQTTVDYPTLDSAPVSGEFRNWLERRLVARGIPFLGGIQVTVKEGIKDERHRRAVRRGTGGTAVDMESHFVNRWARTHGVSVAVVKIVTDAADANAMVDFRKNLHRASRKLAELLLTLEVL